MVKQVLVQLLPDTPDNYRWGIVNEKGQWENPPNTGDKATLLSSLQTEMLPIVLVIPGEKTVATRVAYHAAEKRHFRQLLPYQLEEQIIGDVEDFHFAIGPLQTDSAIVIYVDDAWFAETIAWYESHGFTISRCVVDFQLLTPDADQWIIWSTGPRVLCCHGSGLGFAINCHALQPVLDDLLNEDDQDIQLYGDSEQTLDDLTKWLPESVRLQASKSTGEPVLDLLGNDGVNFCQGPYAPKLPLNQWWRASRTSAILAVAALAAFIAVNLLEVFQLKDRQQIVKQQIEKSYRAVAPQGAMVDPVKQLQRKLGATDIDVNSSQAIYLISLAAPAIEAQDIDIRTLAYNNNDQSLQLTIEAKAFRDIETLRKQLQNNGLRAQLKRSDSSEDTVQARLYISVAEG